MFFSLFGAPNTPALSFKEIVHLLSLPHHLDHTPPAHFQFGLQKCPVSALAQVAAAWLAGLFLLLGLMIAVVLTEPLAAVGAEVGGPNFPLIHLR